MIEERYMVTINPEGELSKVFLTKYENRKIIFVEEVGNIFTSLQNINIIHFWRDGLQRKYSFVEFNKDMFFYTDNNMLLFDNFEKFTELVSQAG